MANRARRFRADSRTEKLNENSNTDEQDEQDEKESAAFPVLNYPVYPANSIKNLRLSVFICGFNSLSCVLRVFVVKIKK